MRQAAINCLGLITRPNVYGQFPVGAMATAQNCCFRAPGIVEGFSATSAALSALAPATYSIKKIWAGGWADGANLLSAARFPSVFVNVWVMRRGTTAIAGLSTVPTFAVGYCNGVFSRDRWLLADTRNPVVLDTVSDTTLRFAGFEAPRQLALSSVTAVAAAALPTAKVCAWRCHFKRVVDSGYTITGAVSNAFSYSNTSGSTIDVTLQVGWPANSIQVAGDTVELYRTLRQDTGTDPGTDCLLSVSYTLTASDITNKFCLIRDSTIDDALGAALYTNSDQEGLAQSKQIPPTSTDIASFKGYTFYVATEVASSIYVRIPGLWGSLTSAADVKFGIGTRTKTGCTTSNTSPTALVPDTSGLDVGQTVQHADFAAGTAILSIVTNTSVTFDANATGTSVAATMYFFDRLEITGQVAVASSPLNTINSLLSSNHTLVTVDQTLATGTSGSSVLQGAQMRLSVPYALNGSPTIRGTNPQNYSPAIPALAATVQTGTTDPRTNRLIVSELDQPEACPEGNEVLIGHGTVYRLIATRDALWVFASDGLWRLSGEGGDWRVDPVDPTLILAAPQAVDVLGEIIYCYTNRGIVAVSDQGIQEITSQIVDDLMPGASYSADFETFIQCDQNKKEVWVVFRSGGVSTSYVFNTDTRQWSTFSDGNYLSAAAYSPSSFALVYGCNEASTPNINKFLHTTARTGSQILQFQPLTGDGDPATLKQFIDMTQIFTDLTSTESITPYWDGTAKTANSLKFVNNGSSLASEARVSFGTPRNNAVNVSLRPGISFSITTQPWIMRGFSIRWRPAAEESLR